MNNNRLATYHEIITQPVAWQGALDAVAQQREKLRKLWKEGAFREVVFTGCGSTYYLSLAAASLWQTLLRVPAHSMPGGELWFYPLAAFPPASPGQTLLIAISRSGTTSETCAVAERFRQEGRGKIIVITAYPDSPLAALGDVTIAIPAGQEKSVAQTRSFAAMYVATVAIMATLAGRDDLLRALDSLPTTGDKLIEGSQEVVRIWGEDLTSERFYFLGSGPRYGLACEANLKMKEMTLTDSEPFHFFEFRHGPMSMVNELTTIVGLLSEEQREEEERVLQEMQALGGQIFSLAPEVGNVVLPCNLPSAVRNILYLPPLQLAAYYRALAKGLNPDQPANLTAVIELDLHV